MRVRRAFSDDLVKTHAAEAAHDSRSDDPGEQDCADCRAGGAKSYPLEQSQKPEVRQSYEWD
jgi:hypothetical protein